MLLLPKHFDTNEIFLICIAFFLVMLITLLPHKFPLVESFMYFLFNFFLAVVVDHILAGPPLDFYNIMDHAKFEIMDVFNYLFLYCPTGYLFLYFYKRFDKSFNGRILYVILAIGITVGLEWIAIKFNVFHYSKWNLFYSSIAYLFLYIFNILFSKFIKNQLENENG